MLIFVRHWRDSTLRQQWGRDPSLALVLLHTEFFPTLAVGWQSQQNKLTHWPRHISPMSVIVFADHFQLVLQIKQQNYIDCITQFGLGVARLEGRGPERPLVDSAVDGQEELSARGPAHTHRRASPAKVAN